MRSVEAQKRGYEERLKLNKQLSKNLYWRLPVDDTGHENFVPVGRGAVGSDVCGKHVGWRICMRTDLHEGVVVDGRDYTKKVVARHQHLWCNYSSCPICFIRGWAPRLGRKMEGRLSEAVKRGFGKVDHILSSVPPKDYGLSEDALRKKARSAAIDRGVIGGCMIFHGFRPDKETRSILVWSPHYHILGFVPSWDMCGKCSRKGRNKCDDCEGFCGREKRGYRNDEYFVTVKEERKTVYGTAFYQLHHATVRVGVKRFHVVTWFGVLSYNRIKGSSVDAAFPCPACTSDMGKGVHIGRKYIAKRVSEENYESLVLDDEFDDAGDPNWEIAVGGGGRIE